MLSWRDLRSRVRRRRPLFYRATIGDGNALAVEVNLFRHTYNTLRPHQALDERTPRAAYLAVEHCD
jgi:transposase InsO family protein